MLFRDLVVCNKDWDESTRLIIIDFPSNSNGVPQSVSSTARAALSIFGDRSVLWFRDCVVMLL